MPAVPARARPFTQPTSDRGRQVRLGDGCQLTLLDLEDDLLAIADRVDIVEFAGDLRSSGPFDILFVEGSVSTPEQAEEIVRLRAATTMLVTIGACATAGGIQALRNWADHDAIRSLVYPQRDTSSRSRRRRRSRTTSPLTPSCTRMPDLARAAPRVRHGGPRRTSSEPAG